MSECVQAKKCLRAYYVGVYFRNCKRMTHRGTLTITCVQQIQLYGFCAKSTPFTMIPLNLWFLFASCCCKAEEIILPFGCPCFPIQLRLLRRSPLLSSSFSSSPYSQPLYKDFPFATLGGGRVGDRIRRTQNFGIDRKSFPSEKSWPISDIFDSLPRDLIFFSIPPLTSRFSPPPIANSTFSLSYILRMMRSTYF